MTGRISIPALRENLDHSADECEGRCVTAFERREVLALVEAVEAAQQAFAAKLSDRYWNNRTREALARFDFGEDA